MNRALEALEKLRQVQAQIGAKEREYHAAIRSGDQANAQRFQEELAAMFVLSDAAFKLANSEFDRLKLQRDPGV